MFKKISLCATAVAAEFKGTPLDIPLCTAQADTVIIYTTALFCHTSTIKLTGGVDPPKDNTATDGYSATMTVGYTGFLSGNTDSIAYGTCVIPKESAVAEDTAYMKAPRGMCLGITTGSGSTAADAASGITSNNTNILGGFFGHISYADLYTNNAAKADADWTEKSIAAATNLATITAEASSTIIPTGITTMDAVTTYGAITVPAATWYDDLIAASRINRTAAPITTTTTESKATWNQPTEAATYAGVPRLSPADTLGWVSYATNAGTDAEFGRFQKQLDITLVTITDNFATTVAAGVAIIGATALSF